jgi:hypothetical protein
MNKNLRIELRSKIAELEKFLGMELPGKTRDQEKAVNNLQEDSQKKCARIASKIERRLTKNI